jgi:indole-3-glycerol phosphate synthase
MLLIMSILDKIKLSKIEELRSRKESYPVEKYRDGETFGRSPISLKSALAGRKIPGIIAEFKRRSPSRGNINTQADPSEVTRGFVEAGACALSVLTDSAYFGGSPDDLCMARKLNKVPILRKDFIIDEYQLYESRAWGADAILLIAALMDGGMVRDLAGRAGELGLEVLLEIHGEEELGHICREVDLVGVNNRNLMDFSVDIDTSRILSGMIPEEFPRISESGISDAHIIRDLLAYGYRGFLIGEYFMSSPRPQEKCRELVSRLV